MKDTNLLFSHSEASKKSVPNWISIENKLSGLDLIRSPQQRISAGYNNARRLSDTKLRGILDKKIQQNRVPSYYNIGRLIEFKNRGHSIDYYVDSKAFDSLIRSSGSHMGKLYNERFKSTATEAGTFLASLGMSTALATIVEKFKENPEEVKKFVDKVKQRRKLNVDVKYTNDTVRSFFNPAENIAQVGYNKAIAGHELGHAGTFQKSIKVFGKELAPFVKVLQVAELGQIFPIVRRLGPLAQVPLSGLVATPLAIPKVTQFLKGENTKSFRYKLVKKIEDKPIIVGLMAGSPKLFEEGKASIKSFQDLYRFAPKGKKLLEVGKGLKTLLPAYATYVLGAAIPAVSLAFVRKELDIREKLNKKRKLLIRKL